MIYSKFNIEHFRCFGDIQTLIFANPISGKRGSGITYIVGPNNAGKTALIEALWFKEGDNLNDSERRKSPPVFKYYKNDTLVKTVSLSRPETHKFIQITPVNEVVALFEFVSSRRHWEPIAHNTRIPGEVVEQSGKGNKSPRKQTEFETAVYLTSIAQDENRYVEFTALVKRVFPEFSKWRVGFENYPNIQYITEDGIQHSADLMGDGIISVIRILAHLYENRTPGLVIDEPELSLYPDAQRALLQIISEYAESRQIIIATHSPYFLDWEYIKNGARVNRVSKLSGLSRINTLQNYSSYETLIKGANWSQPFLMDVVSKEIFFFENVLFVEGQEDVGLLRPFFTDTKVNLFGYGVRGYKNFEVALQLAKDIGLKKACVLIDGTDPASNSADNENLCKLDLEKYKPDYLTVQWNRTDIRDKKGYNSTGFFEKTGYFTEKGKLKPAEELDDFHEKINVIKEYFNISDNFQPHKVEV